MSEFLGILKDFVRDFLIKKKSCQKSYQGYENGLTLSILKLAKSLIIFGFYLTEDELIKMIDPLITLLDGSDDVTIEDEENDMKKYDNSKEQYPSSGIDFEGPLPGYSRFKTRYEMTESNLTVIKCKFEMCNILEIVMNIQNDIRITRFFREFNDRIAHESEENSVIANRKSSKRSKSFRNFQNTIGNKLERLTERLT